MWEYSSIKRYFYALTYHILTADATEADFIQAIQSNTRDGYDMVYQRYSSTLYGMIVKTVRVESVAMQLFAETITDLWTRINEYDAAKMDLLRWIVFQIVQPKVEKYRRSIENANRI